jgi:hypothetical protein
MQIKRVFAFPCKWTFQIVPIHDLVERYIRIVEKYYDGKGVVVDPFVGQSEFRDRCITNDLNPRIPADYHLPAEEFLRKLDTNSAHLVLFDPPYSPTQMRRQYDDFGYALAKEETNANFTKAKNQVSRVIVNGGYCISLNWNSTGMGKKRGFKKIAILLVNHGSAHHDTIVTVELKTRFKP